MTIAKTQKIIGAIIILVALLVLYIVLDRRTKNAETNNSQTNVVIATTTNGNIQFSTQGTGGYKIEQVPITEGKGVPQPIPDLKAKVVFGTDPSLTPEVKTMVEQKISALQSELLKNPSDLSGWINLGIYQKTAMDYSATVKSWQYASKLAPSDYISLGDLGDLSAYFLHDTVSAEKYYAQAIKNGPTQAYLYIQLAQVQNDIEKNTAKALATVNAGLAKIPNDPNLLQYKAVLSQ